MPDGSGFDCNPSHSTRIANPINDHTLADHVLTRLKHVGGRNVHKTSPFGRALASDVSTLSLSCTTVLDLGCGSGLHTLVAGLCGAIVDASDISAEAVACTRANAQEVGLTICTRVGSGFEPWPDRRWHWIIVNAPGYEPAPPICGEAELNGLQRLSPTPKLLLDVMRAAGKVLHPGGRIVTLIGGPAGYSTIDEEAVRHGLFVELKHRHFLNADGYAGVLLSEEAIIESRLGERIGTSICMECTVVVLRLMD